MIACEAAICGYSQTFTKVRNLSSYLLRAIRYKTIMMSRMDQRDCKILRIILIEGVANVIVLVIKLVAGIFTGSLAVLRDAVHSLTDIINNIVAWLVTRHSAKPADTRHPYGHRKFDTVAVFGLAALLAILAFELVVHAITRETTEITTGRLELGLMLGVLTINIVISTWQRSWARRLNSDILLADANHTFSYVLVTASVIVGWQLSVMGWVWIDRLCALAVAGLRLYLAFGLFKRTLPVLLDERAIEAERLREAVQGIDGVREIRRVRSRWVGSTRAVDLVIEVDAHLSTAAAHEIADRLETLLADRFDIHDVSIHVESHDRCDLARVEIRPDCLIRKGFFAPSRPSQDQVSRHISALRILVEDGHNVTTPDLI